MGKLKIQFTKFLMAFWKNRLLVWIIILATLLAFFYFEKECKLLQIKVDAYAHIASIPIDLEILSEKPQLFSKEISLVVKVRPRFDTSDTITSINIDLPPQVKLVSGETSWSGKLGQDKEKILKFKLRAEEFGEWSIKANVMSLRTNGTGNGRVAEATIKVTPICTTIKKPVPLKFSPRIEKKAIPISPPQSQPESNYDPRGKRGSGL